MLVKSHTYILRQFCAPMQSNLNLKSRQTTSASPRSRAMLPKNVLQCLNRSSVLGRVRHTLSSGYLCAGRPAGGIFGIGRPSPSSTKATAYEAAGETQQRVVIMGGGFGGLYAAIRLTALNWPRGKTPQITLVDKADRFTFKPLLYELLNSSATEEEVAPYFTQVLAPYPIRFIQAQVTGVEPEAAAEGGQGGKIQLVDGSALEYDYLVVALGSQSDSRGVPGVDELAVPFNVYEDAVRVKTALDQIDSAGDPDATIIIVGAGYAGVELASVVAERLGSKARVQLVTPGDDILTGCPEGQRAASRRMLASLGAEVLTGTKVVRLDRSESAMHPTSCTAELQMADGSKVSASADLVLWTAGSSPATGAPEGRKGLPFATNKRGSIQTEPTLQVVGDNRVFAVGDVSRTDPASYEELGTSIADKSALPATAQVAFQQADYVAWNLWAAMNGRTLLPFRYQHLGTMMSLGSLNAAVALPIALPLPLKSLILGSPLGGLLDTVGIKLGGDDPDNGVTVEGPLGAALRRAAYLYRQPTNEQRLMVASGWLQQVLTVAGVPVPK